MKKLKIRKNEQGVTLIALVVTIVVLLILAATSIAMLTGDDGIITNAQKAQVANQEAEVIDKMGLAYSTVRTEAMVKMSTDPGYQPIEHIEELANIAAKEIGLTNAEKAEVPEKITDGYKVYYQENGSTITMLYGDNKFSLKAGNKASNNKYPNIKGVISLSTTEVVYSELPTGIENGNNQGGGNTGGSEADKPEVQDHNHSTAEMPVVQATGEYANNPNIKEVRKGCKGNIPIPKGFNYVQGCDMGGAVISDGNSEFVWIPVDKENLILDLSSTYSTLDNAGVKAEVQKQIDQKKYPMAIKIDEENYIGVLYDFSNYNSADKTTTIQPYSNWTPVSKNDYREPDILSTSYDNDTNIGIINEILKTTYTRDTFATELQKEYNEIVKQIKKYGGFYYGRYEISLDNNKKAQSKKGETSITNATTTESGKSYKWYGLYAQAHNYTNIENSIKSTMISGSQYDQMMIWMANNGVDITSTAGLTTLDITGEGTEKNTNRTTGTADKDKLCNVFDLFGNSYEWTSEADDTFVRAIRSGDYNYNGSVRHRSYYSAGNTDGYHSTRPTLLIK